MKIAAWIIWSVAAVGLMLGLYTTSWDKVSGSVVSTGSFGTFYGGYQTGKAARGGYLRFDKVEYSYWYDDRYYSGRLICICVPIWVVRDVSPGQDVPVYVSKHAPWFGVLRVGPDLLAVFLLILIGAALYYFAHALENLARQLESKSPAD